MRNTRPDDLGGLVVKEALRRAEVDGAAMEDLVLGCAQPESEQGLNVARIIGHLAGLPDETPAMTINRFCSSGLQATSIVADRIAAGAIDAGIAGGVESMSMIPMGGGEDLAQPHPGRDLSRTPTSRWGTPPRTSRASSRSAAPTRTRSRCAATRRRWRPGPAATWPPR